MIYLGHISDDGEKREQHLSEHLSEVSRLTGEFADSFGSGEYGKLLGLCHDLGKYSDEFQKRIRGANIRVDHSTAGAQELNKPEKFPHIFLAPILGHHGGLPDGGSWGVAKGNAREGITSDEPTLADRVLLKKIPCYDAFSAEITITQPASLPEIRPIGEKPGFSVSFLIRMLYSCLVDADFLDTERFMKKGQVVRGGYESTEQLLRKLEKHLDTLKNPKQELNKKRCEILQNCVEAAPNSSGLYSLTVPTGGGKTLASLAFALNHAQKYDMHRVIYVIPYNSIIEQNAAVFAGILGEENVLEHHSNVEFNNDESSESDKKHYLSAENWDAPIIVTTNVQFFESLFAARSSKCRKLHNIAGSVVIFDEAQMIPIPYLKACTRAISELVYNYKCTAVLCSATQPQLKSLIPKEIKITEIIPNHAENYSFFKRNSIKEIGYISDTDLAERLNALPQCLCIVRTRLHAQNIFNLLLSDGSFHLSTLMFPQHRKAVLRHIKRRLLLGLPCRVVATSLIEAGVDIDFPVVYRAKTGLDSVIQAAGRCNREAQSPSADSFVYVFDPDDSYSIPNSQKLLIDTFNMTARDYPDDIDSPSAIAEYFNKLYFSKELDENNILKQLDDSYYNDSIPFKTVAENFKIIKDNTRSILIPLFPKAAHYEKLLRAGNCDKPLLRNAALYSVNVYQNHLQQLLESGIVTPLDDKFARDSDHQIFLLADNSYYSLNTGLPITPDLGIGLFTD